jgi:hypothetical protein
LQGGGVNVNSYLDQSIVTITSSSISGNSAQNVRAHFQKFPLRWGNG